jgi:hypothetical protein
MQKQTKSSTSRNRSCATNIKQKKSKISKCPIRTRDRETLHACMQRNIWWCKIVELKTGWSVAHNYCVVNSRVRPPLPAASATCGQGRIDEGRDSHRRPSPAVLNFWSREWGGVVEGRSMEIVILDRGTTNGKTKTQSK